MHTIQAPTLHSKADLFFISLIILFLELACIRWFSAHVIYLTFFTNVVLLGCFLGISVGCLAASQKRNLLTWSPAILSGALFLGFLTLLITEPLLRLINVGTAGESPQVIFFGTEYFFKRDISQVVIPMEAFCGIFFVLSAFIMVGPGQELGRAFTCVQNRLHAYMLNILGSIVGIVVFAGFSFFELNPFWWFLPVVIVMAYFIFSKNLLDNKTRRLPVILMLIIIPIASSVTPGMLLKTELRGEYSWSPYYLVYHDLAQKAVDVNNLAHQRMISIKDPQGGYYGLPYFLQRDAGGPPFKDVLIIGAGTGNDVSRALQWGAEHIDAVEIDPVIIKIGERSHPDRPYQDSRVHIYQDDGRNFMRNVGRKYDLIIYALVDSLVMHSSVNNIRLESFLFTSEAFSDVKRLLKKEGIFVMYNYFRQGWIVGRLNAMLTSVFENKPLVFHFPPSDLIMPDSKGGFTFIVSGNISRLSRAFEQYGYYSVWWDYNLQAHSENGFLSRLQRDNVWQLRSAKVVLPEKLVPATDNWPFLYIQNPMIPNLNIKGMLIMGVIALIMIFIFWPKAEFRHRLLNFNWQMFFLGAGFMLIETKSVVQMCLLFGSTWMVNSLVFLMVLVMILAASLFVIRYSPRNQVPYYLLLFVALVINSLIPLNYFLGMQGIIRVLGSGILVFTPILFAGVIFAVSFGRSKQPDVDLGFNIAGAMVGGLAEYSSTLLGFQHLVFVTMAFYLLSIILTRPIQHVWKVDLA